MQEAEMKDWKIRGPRAVKEFLGAVADGIGDLSSYHLQWLQHSGVNEHSAVSHIHGLLCEVLRQAVSVDQINPMNLLSMEIVVRRLVQDEVAVARNPRHPDYGGLDILFDAPISSTGSAQLSGFSSWVTDRLKEEAQIMKQSRLWSEEQRHLGSRSDPSGGSIGGGNSSAGGGKKGKKGKAGGSSDGAPGQQS
eukprot:3122585-Amphidinium_carterae.2